jgi:glucose dehydrogenase
VQRLFATDLVGREIKLLQSQGGITEWIKRATPGSCKHAFLLLTTLGFGFLFMACSPSQPQQQQSPTQLSSTQPAQPNDAQPAFSEAEDGQWPMPAKNYASTRYNGLDEINTQNVKRLRLRLVLDEPCRC